MCSKKVKCNHTMITLYVKSIQELFTWECSGTQKTYEGKAYLIYEYCTSCGTAQASLAYPGGLIPYREEYLTQRVREEVLAEKRFYSLKDLVAKRCIEEGCSWNPTKGIYTRMGEGTTPSIGVSLIGAERSRQMVKWSAEHDSDANHVNQEMATVAALYAMPHHGKHGLNSDIVDRLYPKTWHTRWWDVQSNPFIAERIEELSKAGALIAAEIDRLHKIKNNL